ncbi:MAG: polysaccharide deacetylase family protein [Beijerinckiaceae bacterium]
MTMKTTNFSPNRRGLGLGVAATFLSSLKTTADASSPLGTARILRVSASTTPLLGIKSYTATLPLGEAEVILTFDDGPLPATTGPILDALAKEQAKATFYMIGRNARANPQMVRRIAQEGHSIANHTMNHPWTMAQRSFANGVREIAEGEDAIQQALGGKITPFFRFPGLADTPALLAELSRRGNVAWSTDLWASDWNSMAPEQQLRLVMGRLKNLRRGIVLFHDIKAQTAAMMPHFLRRLKADGYRIVHAVG